MVRISRDGDLPRHFEAWPLATSVVAVGWAAGVVAIVAGIAAFARAVSEAGEAAAALLVVLGCVLVVLLVRCRRYEAMVGERLTEFRSGPFRRTLPTGSVTGTHERPATSWRRLYAHRELVLTLSVETRPLVVPSRDPDELRTALVSAGPDREAPTVAGGVDSEFRIPNS